MTNAAIPGKSRFDLHYQSRRREIWWWYCRNWRRGYWKVHLRLFLMTSLALALIAILLGLPVAQALGPAAAVAVVMIAWLPVYPLLRFKPQMRHLTADAAGLATTIGKISGTRSWREMSAVEAVDGYVLLEGQTGNSFVIPPRAFASDDEREAFLAFARQAIAQPITAAGAG